MSWSAEAPANIALIKYMGKVAAATVNCPSNISLSYTLDHLRTRVEIEKSSANKDQWVPLVDEDTDSTGESWRTMQLSEKGQSRFIKHFQFLKNKLGVSGAFQIRSANNFPSDCGLASSASSFAALTDCSYKMALDQSENRNLDLNREEVANLSRQGSGSSCRSFFSPWSVWENDRAYEVEGPKLLHQVIIVNDQVKAVSSSEAHQRVRSSLLFAQREERAQHRYLDLREALQNNQWQKAFEITWAEFWDMHTLFETSNPSFGYFQPKSLEALQLVRDYWQKNNDGPLVTMDAGPNIHLLFRTDQQQMFVDFKKKTLANFQVYSGDLG